MTVEDRDAKWEAKHNMRLCRADDLRRAEEDIDVYSNGITGIKVASFPGGERMWVNIENGSLNEGTGFIANIPLSSRLQLGDAIKYKDGAGDKLPVYAGRAARKK